MNILILTNKISRSAREDQQDLLAQVDFIENILLKNGHHVTKISCDLNLSKLYNQLKTQKADLVVNMVEELNGHDQFASFVPLLLENLHLPYTGASSTTLTLTNNKITTKQILMKNKLSTPAWFMMSENNKRFTAGKYIIKPTAQHASYSLDNNSVTMAKSKNSLINLIKQREQLYKCEFFAEKYIDGREFNVAMIEDVEQPIILPISEIKFQNYKNNHKILTYDAKWATTSNEYLSTIRTFDFPKSDKNLLQKLQKISVKTWQAMNLSGYARIDFRVNHNNDPFILEINTNPCLAPDAGFIAASQQKYRAADVAILEIINAALRRHQKWN